MIIANDPRVNTNNSAPVIAQQDSQANNLEKVLEIVQNLQEKIKQEARQNDSIAIAAQNTFNNTVMNMIQASSKQTSDMIMKMNEFQMQMAQKQMEMITKTLEKISENIKEKAEDKIDIFKYLTLIKESERGGEDRVMKWLEFAEKKAELDREKYSDNDVKEREPLTDTLIRSFAPALGQLIIANANNQVAKNQIGQFSKESLFQEEMDNQRVIKPKSNNNIGEKITRVEPSIKPIKTEKTDTSKSVSFGSGNEQVNLDKVQELIMPVILSDLNDKVDPRLTAKKCEDVLLSNKISKKQALEKCGLDDILSIARSFNLADDKIIWIKELYAHFSDANKQTVYRKNSQGSQLYT